MKTIRPSNKEMGKRWLLTSSLMISLYHCLIVSAASAAPATQAFLENYCYNCHDEETKKGALDLTALKYDPANRDSVEKWILIHDRVKAGEMPPKKKARPPKEELDAFVGQLHTRLDSDDRARIARDGRSIQRRLNVDEYENAVRDLLHAPWLDLKSRFPADGETAGYNKPSTALDLSHVQMERYLSLAEFAIDQVMQQQLQQGPASVKRRFYARDQDEITTFFTGSITFIRRSIYQHPFPLIDFEAQPEVRLLKAPITVGEANPAVREREAIGILSRLEGGFRPHWNQAKVPFSGMYKLKVCGYSLNVGHGGTKPGIAPDAASRAGQKGPPKEIKLVGDANVGALSRTRRTEPISVLAGRDIFLGENRHTGWEFNLTPEPEVHELAPVWLQQDEMFVLEPMRFFRAPIPQLTNTANPLATEEGEPAVAFRWIELEGPLDVGKSDASRRLLFGDLPIRELPKPNAKATAVKMIAGVEVTKIDGIQRSLLRNSGVDRPELTPRVAYEVVSTRPKEDARLLLREFTKRAYRRAVDEAELEDFVELVDSRLEAGSSFQQALIAGYKAVLSSPGFLLVEEPPGPLNDDALATRLALFLWNSPPDDALRQRAALRELSKPEVLRSETERMLADPKSQRFVNAFLDYWLDLRKRNDSDASGTLYPEYQADDFLVNSALRESRMFFDELITRDLPARNVVASDFTYLNERLAKHYGIPGVEGIAMRRVSLPKDSPRGGFLTQAAVLKVTACGTTTSPVVRGKFINERIMGIEIPKPPPSVPAVEPDIRGATTLRLQLEKHRNVESCAGCHIKIDPPGFALESFDVMGGFRERYRAVDEAKPGVPGYGYNGLPFAYHEGPPVDATGQFADGTPFRDIREFKAQLLKNEPALARNLARNLVIYATGAPITYSDRAALDAIVEKTAAHQHGVRSLIHAIVQSELFRNK